MEWVSTVGNHFENFGFKPSPQGDPVCSGLFSLTHPATCKDRRRRQAELRPGIPFNPFKASECVHSLVFCGARAETMRGLWLLRGMYSSFTQSAQAAALSSCPTLSLSQPDRPEGRSRMLFQLARRRPEDQYVACWSRVREKTTDGLGRTIVPKFQTKSSGYFHCLGKFYTVYARYLCFFTLWYSVLKTELNDSLLTSRVSKVLVFMLL